jgi:hypothetical protein
VLADEQPAPFGSESSPFARLEAEQAASAAEHADSQPERAASTETRHEPPAVAVEAPGNEAAGADARAFRSEPQRLVSSSDGPPPADEPEDPGEVDRVMLAKEFSGLLQLDGDGDED